VRLRETSGTVWHSASVITSVSSSTQPGPVLRTERLVLRPWTEDDVEPFADMNADPEVMEHFPAPMSVDESRAMVGRIREHFDEHGYGLWAIEPRPGQPVVGFLGFVGLAVPRFEAAFMPCVEVGWRLRRAAWGHGYATEAARAAVDYGFSDLGLAEIVSFTTMRNARSRAVMERLGMSHDPAEDFEHPNVPEGHPVRPHVLYRLSRAAWREGQEPGSGGRT
jgi:RimJ/RimL family protein N-acetyltransferase